jgi:hypothetical protein
VPFLHRNRGDPGEDAMPKTKKGKKILAAMKDEYGSKKGEQVFYASANKGTIKGVHKAKKSKKSKK